MGTCDAINHVGVLASYAVLDGPSLPSQGARVGVGVGGVYTAEAPGFSTLLKTWQCSAAGSSPPVHWGQLSSHKDVSQVGWSQVRHHGSSCHPFLHTGVPLHQKVVVLVHDAGGVGQSSVEGERQDDWSLLLCIQFPGGIILNSVDSLRNHCLYFILLSVVSS